jgi:transposase
MIAIVLAEDGINQQDIANGLDLHQSTVSRVLHRFHETGNTLEDLDKDADEQQQLNGIVFCFYSR